MLVEFPSVQWDAELLADARELIRLAAAEDLPSGIDWTTTTLVDPAARGAAEVVARGEGVVAGLGIGPLVIERFEADAEWTALVDEGDAVEPGTAVARLEGRAADLLTCERTILNFLGRMSGVATLTRRFVDQTAGTAAKLYDTRKTIPGWRRLDKYAVACGGGVNHRLSLSAAVLIKDNHLAHATEQNLTPGDAVTRARAAAVPRDAQESTPMIIEVEVDTLAQLGQVLPARPDIVLLDNMSLEELRRAVALRDESGTATVLEASGGVNLGTVGDIARTGVDRISVGALTHSAVTLDLGLDWR